MKTLQSFLNGGILGFGLFSGIVKLFIGFSAITFHQIKENEMTPQNFLVHRYGEMK
jgi:hypothetical protein